MDDLRFVLERLRLVVAANKHNLSIYNKYIVVLQEAILILSCSNFCASCRLTSSCVDEKQQKLKKPISLLQVLLHIAIVLLAISPYLLTNLTPN